MNHEELVRCNDVFTQMRFLTPEELPKLELYMDQVLTVLERSFRSYTCPGEPVMTSSQVNQFIKAKLLPPHNRKKYSAEHLMRLETLFFLKDVLSVRDLSSLFCGIAADSFSSLYERLSRERKRINDKTAQEYADCVEILCGPDGGEEGIALLIMALAMEADTYKRLAERILDRWLSDKEPVNKEEA